MVSKENLGNTELRFRIDLIIFIALLIFSSTCFLKLNFSSRIKPRCFSFEHLSICTLLKNRSGWSVLLLLFFEKTTSFIGFYWSGLNNIFHWIAQFLIFSKSFSNSSAVSIGVLTAENIAVSSANNLTFGQVIYERKKKKRP